MLSGLKKKISCDVQAQRGVKMSERPLVRLENYCLEQFYITTTKYLWMIVPFFPVILLPAWHKKVQ